MSYLNGGRPLRVCRDAARDEAKRASHVVQQRERDERSLKKSST